MQVNITFMFKPGHPYHTVKEPSLCETNMHYSTVNALFILSVQGASFSYVAGCRLN